MINWEDLYLAGDTPWDRGGPHPALVSELANRPFSGRVMVPGCGLGYDVEAIAVAGGVSEVVGIDIAETAVTRARKRLDRFPEVTRIELGDLFALAPEFIGHFDWVWEHTCFCAIEPSLRTEYVDAVADALAPGGRAMAVFFLTPWDSDEENRTAGPPFGVTLDALDRLLERRFNILRTWVPKETYAGREGREVMRLLSKS